MSEDTRNLLIHYARVLASAGHADCAAEILTMCGFAVTLVTIRETEGYSDQWPAETFTRGGN